MLNFNKTDLKYNFQGNKHSSRDKSGVGPEDAGAQLGAEQLGRAGASARSARRKSFVITTSSPMVAGRFSLYSLFLAALPLLLLLLFYALIRNREFFKTWVRLSVELLFVGGSDSDPQLFRFSKISSDCLSQSFLKTPDFASLPTIL